MKDSDRYLRKQYDIGTHYYNDIHTYYRNTPPYTMKYITTTNIKKNKKYIIKYMKLLLKRRRNGGSYLKMRNY